MGCILKGTMPRSFLDGILYICILLGFQCAFSIFNMVLSLVSTSVYTVVLVMQSRWISMDLLMVLATTP